MNGLPVRRRPTHPAQPTCPAPAWNTTQGVLEPQLASSLAGTPNCPMAPTCSQLCPDTWACTLAHHPSTYMHVCTHIIQTHHEFCSRHYTAHHIPIHQYVHSTHCDQCSGEPAFPHTAWGPLSPQNLTKPWGPPGTCPPLPLGSSCKSELLVPQRPRPPSSAV